MSAIAAKWISSIVLLVATLAVSVFPVIIFNYFTKRKHTKKREEYSIRRTDTFNISSISSANQQQPQASRGAHSSEVDNDSVTGSGENVIRRTRSNSIGSISSISSRKLTKRSAAILQIFMFFGGGVLLATCFCHLMPEAKENFEKYVHKHMNHSVSNTFASSEEASFEVGTELPNLETTPSPELLLNGDFKMMINSTDLPTASRLHGRLIKARARAIKIGPIKLTNQ